MTASQRQERASYTWKITFHVLAWLAIFLASQAFFFFMRIEDKNLFLRTNIITLFHCTIFYVNYLWLIRRYLERGEVFKFLSINCCALLVAIGLMVLVYGVFPMNVRFSPQRSYWPLIFKDSFVFAIVVFVSVAVHFSRKWKKTEEARQVAEMGRTAAELQHLRNQLNPHFLLNTLNNIYALIAFDSERAQTAILDLSTMLRYVLYENNTERTPLTKEIDFLHKYIALMKIRLPQEVDIRFDTDVPHPEEVRIAPLIFISLVENAFKHGVSATAPSFIAINLKREGENLLFKCCNSNHPKDDKDHSGSGIGLQQVAQRLQLSYPDRHEWCYGVDDSTNTYCATIKIRLS